MLRSIVVAVTPTAESRIPAFAGRAVQAWFLNEVSRYAPALAEAIHQGAEFRPYTVSDLVGFGPVRSGQRVCAHDRSGWLRITTLSQDLSDVLIQRILPGLPGTVLDIEGAYLHVDSIAATSDEHRWAGSANPQELLAEQSLSNGRPRVTLRFASPTTFRSGGLNVPFPLPGLVFGSLVDRWNAFVSTGLHPDTRTFATERIAASKYQLRSKYVSFAGGQRGAAVGCLGRSRYAVLSSDHYWTGVIRALAAFAFYSGVGARTTMGLGQVRLLPDE